jgi:hypothetical protein
MLEIMGFAEVRQRGPILLRQIAKDIGLTVEDFLRNR